MWRPFAFDLPRGEDWAQITFRQVMFKMAVFCA